ncbi:hypothetical protein SCHPADRAFT_994821 [Schizopora paradoxa]|uniref:Uncharacterized protein n=1 Tax=Schizopora paradoxa TaxID=27342 RepID=A0A0H2RZ02_9AGAM|nr:hypothetical protein SCHPADRAFT_994821 [Schizopora paradoxa]
MASQAFTAIASAQASRRQALAMSPPDFAVKRQAMNATASNSRSFRLSSNVNKIIEKGKELLARRSTRLGPHSERDELHSAQHQQASTASPAPAEDARPANHSPTTTPPTPSGSGIAPSNDDAAQHAIHSAAPKTLQASIPNEHSTPGAPEEPPNPDGPKEPMLEFEDLQAHVDLLNEKKEQLDALNSKNMKSLNDLLSCATVMRIRFRGVMEEARRMEQLVLQCAREGALVAGTAEDGEQDAEHVDEVEGTLSEEEIEEEEETRDEEVAEADSSLPRVIRKRVSGQTSASADTEKSPSSLRKRARGDFDGESEAGPSNVTANADDTPTRASKKRRNEAPRATSQQAGEPSGSAAPRITVNRDGPLVTPPAIEEDHHRGKSKGKKPMRGEKKERSPSPAGSPTGKSKGKRKADEVDLDDEFSGSPTTKKSKRNISPRPTSKSPSRRLS